MLGSPNSRVNSEKWAYSRNTPKTVFSDDLGPDNSMVMLVGRLVIRDFKRGFKNGSATKGLTRDDNDDPNSNRSYLSIFSLQEYFF